ncbi:hypothetical protein ILUMI_20000 [Ignelater luminosus]|uniref:Uncharacterized protein n=1 Tax=Ignelater luminosus TaxID=2038154 RepID=A0A8K0CKK2_IGNLU|nr:hypothetical protein ILUMI_20000 [Ignelater luminosus]
MNLLWYHFGLTFILIIYILPSTTSHRWCIPHADYTTQCNRCWCVEDQVFVCSRVQCDRVPPTFWKLMKPKSTAQGTKAMEEAMQNDENKHGRSEKTFILPKMSDMLKTAFNMSQEKVRAFWNWIKNML